MYIGGVCHEYLGSNLGRFAVPEWLVSCAKIDHSRSRLASVFLSLYTFERRDCKRGAEYPAPDGVMRQLTLAPLPGVLRPRIFWTRCRRRRHSIVFRLGFHAYLLLRCRTQREFWRRQTSEIAGRTTRGRRRQYRFLPLGLHPYVSPREPRITRKLDWWRR